MNAVGFKPSYMEVETEENTISQPPMQVHNVGGQGEQEIPFEELFPNCSHAQIEVKKRIQMTVTVMMGKGFSKLPNKAELIDELAFLTALDTELTLKSK